jgi:GAF domain-containing protein/predicted pyridoxine 5'-phosphate oxidase superfamily flavin-nucleotide-binding protein
MSNAIEPSAPTLRSLQMCFEGAVPAVVATASKDGLPNITYLSRVHRVDDERVALSNQFFSKTSRNLAENPRASMLLIDPTTYDQFRLTLVYERTERRGPVFERLRDDVDALAALTGMQDVFKLRAADVYRVLHIEQIFAAVHREAAMCEPVVDPRLDDATTTARLADLSARLSRCPDLDTLVSATVDGLRDCLGYEHALLLLLDEEGKKLYTIASCGYESEGVGSEVTVGDGIVGMAAARCAPMRVGNVRQMNKYARSVQRSYEGHGIRPGREIPVPGLLDAESRVAVPALALGELIGVLLVESRRRLAFDDTDVALLTAVAGLAASAIEHARAREQHDDGGPVRATRTAALASSSTRSTRVRFFATDGSTFLDGDYLIKGVAGRILWSLLGHYEREQRVEFTNKEVRLDPTLELPEFRDNLESRLILLKRRLEERNAPIQIQKTGRGRFRLKVDTALRLETVSAPP